MNDRLAAGTYRCRDVARSVAAAMNVGVTWVDTAPNYASGTAEASLRSVLEACPQVRVSTKVGFVPDSDRPAARDAGVLPHDRDRGHCLARPYIAWQLARSRARLGRAPDLVFVHNPEHDRADRADPSRTLTEAFEELERSADAGDIGGYGVATWSGLSSGMFTVSDLTALAEVRTDRMAVRQAYLDRAMPKYLAFLGGPVPTAPPAWSTAHGDLHWANLAGPELGILDWEGWGAAPVGYDAALLHAYSTGAPETAERVRRELSALLDSEGGRFAELVVITELLQSAERGDNLQLVPALRQRAEDVWHRMTVR
ncbi:aldo/keto reductase [Streptomyces prasinus]|uniref:aldo/keto reductase n=1 Tax=Streptomyces prasinus TaxID=67345 RepID=UPI003677D6D2